MNTTVIRTIVLVSVIAAALTACPSATTGPGPITDPSTPSEVQPSPAPKPVVTAVGTPVGAPSSKIIGASGGTLESNDGTVQLEIPAGALASDTNVSIQGITNNAPGTFGRAFRLIPEGTTFAKPVKLTFALQDEQVQSSPLEKMNVGFQRDGYWLPAKVTNRDAAKKTVTVETAHFSDWSLVPVETDYAVKWDLTRVPKP